MIWVLGPYTLEMAAIYSLLKDYGQEVYFAAYGGKRVSEVTKYKATGLIDLFDQLIKPYQPVLVVGCAPSEPLMWDTTNFIEESEWYDRTTNFLDRSLIGKVWAFLARNNSLLDSELPLYATNGWLYDSINFKPSAWHYCQHNHYASCPDDVVYTAAAAYCLRDAYAGCALDVKPRYFANWRLNQLSKFHGTSVPEIVKHFDELTAAYHSHHAVKLTPGWLMEEWAAKMNWRKDGCNANVSAV